jgi:hypothetical protein
MIPIIVSKDRTKSLARGFSKKKMKDAARKITIVVVKQLENFVHPVVYRTASVGINLVIVSKTNHRGLARPSKTRVFAIGKIQKMNLHPFPISVHPYVTMNASNKTNARIRSGIVSKVRKKGLALGFAMMRRILIDATG